MSTIPDESELRAMMGDETLSAMKRLMSYVESHYKSAFLWGSGGKKWKYECKVKVGSKTLCSFFPAAGFFGLMIIFGAAERTAFEAQRESFPEHIVNVYDNTKQYHDGRWLMFELRDDVGFDDYVRLINIKKKPVSA